MERLGAGGDFLLFNPWKDRCINSIAEWHWPRKRIPSFSLPASFPPEIPTQDETALIRDAPRASFIDPAGWRVPFRPEVPAAVASCPKNDRVADENFATRGRSRWKRWPRRLYRGRNTPQKRKFVHGSAEEAIESTLVPPSRRLFMGRSRSPVVMESEGERPTRSHVGRTSKARMC